MSVDVLFYTQVASILGFIGAVFGIYRLWINQKDSTIELLKERVSYLESQLKEAQRNDPDMLADNLGKRVDLLTAEIKRLKEDSEANASHIEAKEEEKRKLKDQILRLRQTVEDAEKKLKEITCPYCGEPVAERSLITIGGSDEEIELVSYRCGYEARDDEMLHPCPTMVQDLDEEMQP